MNMLATRIRNCARRLRNTGRSSVVVLLYHRVSVLETDPHCLAVSPSRFQQHLEVLSRNGWAMTLADLVKGLRGKRLPRRGVVVTFDDGYADNLHAANPLLERYGVPATIFVASGLVGQPEEIWSDELDRLLLATRTLPRAVRVVIQGKEIVQDLAGETSGSRIQWSMRDPVDPQPRHQAYRRLFAQLQRVGSEERVRAMNDLRMQISPGSRGRDSHRYLSISELTQLAGSPMVEIGAHSVSHVSLAAASTEQQREEIRRSKADLEQVTRRAVRSFSYPFGSRDQDYTRETMSEVADASYECACSGSPGTVRLGAPLYELPRDVVLDWDGEEFEKRIRWWFIR